MPFILLSYWLACSNEKPSPEEIINPATVFVLDISETESNWYDAVYLATIPTSAKLNGGYPAIIATESADEISPSGDDLLRRFAAETAYVMDSNVSVAHSEQTIVLQATSAAQWSAMLVEEFWQASQYLIVTSSEDYSGAVVASSMASLLDAPLVFADSGSDDIVSIAQTLEVEQIITVGIDEEPPSLSIDSQSLNSMIEILSWLDEQDIVVSYLTISNPNDRNSGRSQKASLVAPLYAAKNDGLSILYALDMPTDDVIDGQLHPVVSFLDEVYESIDYHPDYLAIVGAHDALPLSRKPSIFDNPENEHPVSDLPYGQVDNDEFLDIAVGRIVGDTVQELTTSATRNSLYNFIVDDSWSKKFVEGGLWGFDELRDLMINVGFETPEHLSEEDIASLERIDAAAILHKDHSYCQVLGHAFDISTTTLLSPAVVLSRGCSVGGIDLLQSHQRSIVEHMFGLGAVAFVGASRNSIAYNTIIEVSMWNQMIAGKPIGQAFQHGINDAIVHWIDEQSAAMRYSLDIEILYGDPALQMPIPSDYNSEPAKQLHTGNQVEVTSPEVWNLVQYHPEQLAEWSYSGELFMYTGAGANPMTYWAGSYDKEDMYFGVQVHLDDAPDNIVQEDVFADPLGWSERYHLDWHQDGSVTALWKVRLLDFDEQNGNISAQAESFVYTIE